jgi:hypothetical protein
MLYESLLRILELSGRTRIDETPVPTTMVPAPEGMRNWMTLLDEAVDRDAIETSAQGIITARKGQVGYWIDSTGQPQYLPKWGHHEDSAYRAFGFSGNRKDDRPTGNYSKIAMEHGWFRMLCSRGGLEININFIAGKPTRDARQAVSFMISHVMSWYAGQPVRVIFEGYQPVEGDALGEPSIRNEFNKVAPALAYLRKL